MKNICNICNVSFNTAIFLNQMKIAKVIPIVKYGEKVVFTNYIHISLLPQFSKIHEKITTSLDNNKYAIGIFVDLKKHLLSSVITYWQHIILFYGIYGVAYKWIMSYLENINQFVHHENVDT